MVESVDTEDLKSFALRRGGSSPSISIKIMKDLKENTIKTFQKTLKYSLYTPNGNRSSKRTDILHKGILEDILSPYIPEYKTDWNVHYEHKILCSRADNDRPNKDFSIDICLENKKNKNKIYILIKSIEKSYNKNKENYANTQLGELQRIYGRSNYYGESLRKQRLNDTTLFFTLLPTKVLAESSKNTKIELTKYTEPNIEDLRLFNKNVHNITMLLNNDLQVAEDKSYLDSFNNCEIKNIEDVKRKLKQFSDNL